MPTKETMPGDELQEHIFSSYLHLRYGAAIIGALLPLIIYAVGILNGVPLADSISDYYWVPDGPDAHSRDLLVGCLFAVAAILYLYKGFSKAENIALNLAALLAAGVALFPTAENDLAGGGDFSIHGFCAVSMFICLVYVVWFRADDTLHLLPAGSTPSPARYRQLYRIVGGVMLVSPLTAFIVNSIIGTETSFVFFIEVAGIWAFAAYWLLKGSELKRSGATRKALQGEADSNPPAVRIVAGG
jgi:hypothetical protein